MSDEGKPEVMFTPEPFTLEEILEVRALVLDLERNPFSQGELRVLGGVRYALSDSTLRKIGIVVEGPRPPMALLKK